MILVILFECLLLIFRLLLCWPLSLAANCVSIASACLRIVCVRTGIACVRIACVRAHCVRACAALAWPGSFS